MPSPRSSHWTLAVVFAVACAVAAGRAEARTWSLSDQQRRAYLGYYSPIILKRADEDRAGHAGYDWITNYDFDRNGAFSDNKANWEGLAVFLKEGRDPLSGDGSLGTAWRIRPTLYTALIEFMEAGRKSVILLYHVYHAKQQGSIHDWERVELRVDGVTGTPGTSGEGINYAVITEHSKHNRRVPGDADLNFMETRHGKHLLLWQAEWSDDWLDFDKNELHWVEDRFDGLDRDNRGGRPAEVNVNGDPGLRNVNYVFVCGCDPEAAAYWQARAISRETAREMAAGTRDRMTWDEVPRALYELQDIADILPSHWQGGGYARHWRPPARLIALESPILDEDRAEVVPAGLRNFYPLAADGADPSESRLGYPAKHWFWGAYRFGERNPLIRDGDRLRRRLVPQSAVDRYIRDVGKPLRQHAYFAHDAQATSSGAGPSGRWLPPAWHRRSHGGFDGRWVQLFADGPM